MRIACVVLPLLMTYWIQPGVQAAELRAGVVRVDITPPLSMNSPLGGYGDRMNKPATGIHDRIFAKALTLEDGTRKFVIVTADMLGLPPTFKPEVVKQLNDAQFGLGNLILLPSHSHTSVEINAFHPGNTFKIPQVGIYNQPVHQFLIEKFAEAIRKSAEHLVPVRIGTASQAIPGWNRNRRNKDGLKEEDLTITRIDTLDGKSLAVLVNFTAHPTFLSSEQMEFSGDWPGQLQMTLESIIGPSTTVMYYNGAEGDQSVVPRPDSGSSRWEKMIRYGTELGVLAGQIFSKIETRQDVAFEFHREEFDLPPNSWHPRFKETGGKEYGLTEELLKEMLPKMYPRKTASVTLRLGDLLLIGIPGEMVAELGRTIKQRAAQQTGAAYPVIGGIADEWDGYILSAPEYRLGGYETSVSFYGETFGQTIVDGALKGVSALATMPKSK